MHILLLRHYPLVEGPSMRAFACQIAEGLRGRGHRVTELSAPVVFGQLVPRSHPIAKWLGYLDQFLIFPPLLWLRVRLLSSSFLCVFSDQALGPWMPWLRNRPHIVHCHDLLALESSLGLQPFHRLSRSGSLYQRWILHGFRRARFFLSVSSATQEALERHLDQRPKLSAVLYNPLPVRFAVVPPDQANAAIRINLPQLETQTYLFHIGRNWYKNRLGILAIWEQLHRLGLPQHLVLVGTLDSLMQAWILQRPQLAPYLHVLDRASDDLVVALYNRAELLLFPSHSEGFGWPILEGLACGCPVVTTHRPPMTEVGGFAVTTIPPAPPPPLSLEPWALNAAMTVQMVLKRSPTEKERIRQLGFAQASRFLMEPWLDKLESYYHKALLLQENRLCPG